MWNKTNTAKSKNTLPTDYLCNNIIEWDKNTKHKPQSQMHNLNLQNQQSSNKKQRQHHQHEEINGKNAIRTINECKLQTVMQLYRIQICCKFAVCHYNSWSCSFSLFSFKWNYLTHFNLPYETPKGWSERTIGCE